MATIAVGRAGLDLPFIWLWWWNRSLSTLMPLNKILCDRVLFEVWKSQVVGLFHVINDKAFDTRNIHQVEEDPKKKRTEDLQSSWYDAILWPTRSAHPTPSLGNLTTFGKVTADFDLELFSLGWAVDKSFKPSSVASKSRTDQLPVHYLGREICCLLVSFLIIVVLNRRFWDIFLLV